MYTYQRRSLILLWPLLSWHLIVFWYEEPNFNKIIQTFAYCGHTFNKWKILPYWCHVWAQTCLFLVKLSPKFEENQNKRCRIYYYLFFDILMYRNICLIYKVMSLFLLGSLKKRLLQTSTSYSIYPDLFWNSPIWTNLLE